MTEETSLTAILDGGNTDAQPVSQPVTATEQAKPDTATQATGDPAKGDVEAGTPPTEKPKSEKSEADKAFATLRRELKNERQQREALAAQLQQIQAPPRPVLDPLAMDPADFDKAINDRISQTALASRLATSEEIAADKYPDYEEMRDVFAEEVQKNPTIYREMLQARNPAEFAYQFGKQTIARQEIGDPVQFAEKIRQETIAKTMTDLDKIVEEKVKARLAGILPSSLADAQTQGTRATNPDGFNGPTPLSDILKRK